MLDIVKRHAFLLVLGAAVLIISLVLGLTAYFAYVKPNSRTRQLLQTTQDRAQALSDGPLYTEALVAEMAKQVERRQTQYESILENIRRLGKQRKPLVEKLFPVSTDIGLRHSFKVEYDVALAKFMKRLEAALPPEEKKPDGTSKTATKEKVKEGVVMYAHPRVSFYRPDWVDKQEAPSLDLVRYGQENIWLMEDLVGIIAGVNDEALRAAGKRTMVDAAVKELVEIRIGDEYAVLSGTKMPPGSGRYRVASRERLRDGLEGGATRTQSLTGRASQPDFYRVLPFRLVVIVESRYAGELIRRLKDTESFITVEAWRLVPITAASIERARDVMASSREGYGSHGVVRLEVTGESLVFLLQGGRITTLPASAAPAPSEAPTPPAAATESSG